MVVQHTYYVNVGLELNSSFRASLENWIEEYFVNVVGGVDAFL